MGQTQAGLIILLIIIFLFIPSAYLQQVNNENHDIKQHLNLSARVLADCIEKEITNSRDIALGYGRPKLTPVRVDRDRLLPEFYGVLLKNSGFQENMVKFKIDSVGFNNFWDVIDITAHFFAMDKKGYIYPADIYIPDKNGTYRLLQNSEYVTECQHLTVSSANRAASETNPADPEYNTWTFQYYIPYTAKAVRQGTVLDLYNPNAFDNKLLVVFDLRGIKREGDFCDYTLKESDWAIGNGSVYGYNYPSLNNLIGKGVNHGEVFWYNLFETAAEDLRLDREW